jgi:fermentation-respiration switch protein FrsA (DUF1100 family)
MNISAAACDRTLLFCSIADSTIVAVAVNMLLSSSHLTSSPADMACNSAAGVANSHVQLLPASWRTRSNDVPFLRLRRARPLLVSAGAAPAQVSVPQGNLLYLFMNPCSLIRQCGVLELFRRSGII